MSDFDREKANRELAVLCGMRIHTRGLAAIQQHLPDFFPGLNEDGTCDETAVDGALLWRVWCALVRTPGVRMLELHWGGHYYIANIRVWPEGAFSAESREEVDAHPCVALYLCARAAGMLKGETDAD